MKQEVKKSKRYIPLDVMRGLTIVMMILFNNLGDHIIAPFEHAPFNGFTLVDWIFPSFVFCLGLSLLFSLKNVEKIDKHFVYKTVKRFVLLLAIMYSINFISGMCRNLRECKGFSYAFFTTFANFRIPGVFFRLAFISLIAPFIIILCKKDIKKISIVSASILVIYAFILGFGNGYQFSSNNICYIVDSAIFTPAHMYKKTVDGVRMAFDPEGIISTIPTIAHALIGFIVGKLFINKNTNRSTSVDLFSLGVILIVISLPFGLTFIPYNKTVWSSSFVLLTSGISCIVLALFNFIFSFKLNDNVLITLKAFGCNSLFLYVVSTLITIAFNNIPLDASLNSIHHYISLGFNTMCLNNLTASEVSYSILLILLNIPLAIYLYKKKIYIKL